MKILNKFIWSKTEPKNKNDVWFDGDVFNLYRNDTWEAFTLPVDAAEKVAEVIKNVSEVYQEKLNAGYGIIIEGNTISVDPNLKNYDDTQVWEYIDSLQQNKANRNELNNYVPTERFVSTTQTLSDSLGEIAAIKADKTEVNKELNKKLNKTDVATINGKSITGGGNITIESSGSYDDTEVKQELAKLSAEVSDISTIINGKNESEDITNKFAFVSNGGFYIAEPIGATYKGELKYTTDGDYAPGVNVSEYNSVVVSVERSGGNRNVIITDANDVVVFCEKWGDHQDNLQIQANIIDLKGVTMYVSKSAGASCSIMALVTKEGLVDKIADNPSSKVVYVSKNGSDDNKGDKENPFATIQKAIDSNATRILVGQGTYNETLDLAQYTQSRLELLNADLFGEVIIEKTPTILATKDGNLISGSSVVREMTITGVTAEMRCLVQLGVPYGEISIDERRPEQRGRQTRLNDTIIKRVKNVSSVTAAIAEIERAYTEDGVYMYYLSGTTMYYARPQAFSASNPLVRPTESAKLFKNAPKNMTYIISKVHTRFLAFNIEHSINSVITDCVSEHSHASGGFLVNGGIGVEFVRCEAMGCCYSSTGDGFNAHASGIDGYNEGEPTSKCCTIRLVNCWSHDNNDDGFSDHDRCESNVIGGLYEYNGKGGIVPSYGSHCTCYNVESRHNCNGFLSTGTPEGKEGGVGTQLTCYGCLARDNRNKYGQNYINGVDETNAGFAVMSSDCQLIAVGCVAINNKMGFFTNSGSSVVNTHSELVDCKVMSNDIAYYPKDDAIVKVTNPTNL